MGGTIYKNIAGLLAILLAFTIIPISSLDVGCQNIENKKVNVLIDFGDGIIKWVEIEISTNTTAIFTTEKVVEKIGIEIGSSWSEYGVFVFQIGEKLNTWPGAYWHFWLWNQSSNEWSLSNKGSDQVNLEHNDSIAWSFVVDDEQFISPKPVANPNAKYPSVCFRNNLYNSGKSDSPAPGNSNLLWKFNLSSFEADSTPVIVNEKVFINSWEGFYCLNEENSNKIWQNLGIKGESSPAYYDGALFTGASDGKMYSLDEKDGKILWSTLLQTNPVFTGISSSPKVFEGRVFIGTFNETGGNGGLFCLNANNGEIIWNRTTSSIHLSSPAVLNDKIIISQMGLFDPSKISWNPEYGINCYERDTGNLSWKFQTNGAVASSPAVFENKIFFTSQDGNLYWVDENGNKLWSRKIGTSISSPAIYENKIYVGSGTFGKEGKIYCLNLNGNILWEFIANGGIQSSPSVADGKVFFGTNVENGSIYCLNSNNGELIWDYIPEPEQYILASPTIANEKLFICSDNGYLYVFAEWGESDVPEEIEENNDFIPELNFFYIICIIGISSVIFIKKRKKGEHH